ncbi:MAG: FAD-binding protein [Alphaproteobacteria bacterium]|nr:FAD-binding protein [Alphaproteobacteria bacterium]
MPNDAARALPELIQALGAVVGARLSTAAAVRDQHGHGESYHPTKAPDVVVFPSTVEEVAGVVRVCAEHAVPIIPFGTGTGLEGGTVALHGGVSIDVSGLDRIVAIRPEDMNATVQAGVTRKRLNAAIRDQGLFFPIDPGADASLGGMCATRASGTNAVRYGTMRENVLGLTVVLADGRVVRAGGQARKSAAGYDLTRLFVGSEGTLGVIVEVTVRLYGIPESMSAAVCSFPTVADAINAVILTIQSGIPVARIEFLDDVQVDAINRYAKLDNPVAPTLFFEFHGSTAGVVEQAEQAQAIARDHGGTDFRWATQVEDRAKLWQARHDAYYAALALRPDVKGWATDVCVPISRLAECIVETKRDIQASTVMAPMVGHVGDGNFHLTFLVNPFSAEEMAEAHRVNDRMLARALAMGGTCTGEHGVGYGKIAALENEAGEAVAVMRAIKQALDPGNLMNPGKVVRTWQES